MQSTYSKRAGRGEDVDLAAHPLGDLSREDLDLITEWVLRSGSLKGLASAYGVSYPTIRNRVDGVIERLRRAAEGRTPDPMSELLARLVEAGDVSPSAARAIRDLAREIGYPAGDSTVVEAGPTGGSS